MSGSEPESTPAAHRIRVRDYTRTPGARYLSDGPFSGEHYRETILIPAFYRALAAGEQLVVELDGAAGYATSFLEETFGGLVRAIDGEDIPAVTRPEPLKWVSTEQIRATLRVSSEARPRLEASAERYLSAAIDRRTRRTP